jgi:uncharacterized phage protein (predicted DNA packaging)
MKFSEVNLDFVKSYLQIDWSEDDNQLEVFIDSAKDYILTIADGTKIDELDNKKVSVIILLKVVSDFYQNRSTTTNVQVDPLYTEMIKQIRSYSL